MRIHGVLTSLRLENMAWDILAEMAEAEGRTTNALVVLFHDEIMAHRGEVPNFASFLRVTCMRYLRRSAMQAGRGAEASADGPAPPGGVAPGGVMRLAVARPAAAR